MRKEYLKPYNCVHIICIRDILYNKTVQKDLTTTQKYVYINIQ